MTREEIVKQVRDTIVHCSVENIWESVEEDFIEIEIQFLDGPLKQRRMIADIRVVDAH